MKGIILAGGSGTRLYPLTLVTSKQLLPIYDKPMIYYPLSILMMAGIKDILIISTSTDTPRFETLFGNGSNFGISMSYAIQERPEGLAQAFIIGEEFIGDDACAMILGDNIFYGANIRKHLINSVERANKGMVTLFGYYVPDPERFGVIELDKDNNAISIEEKPENPKSNYAATGLYFYPKGVAAKAKQVELSPRGEYEITTLNNMYLKEGIVHVTTLGRGYAWLDTGTTESLNEASNFIRIIEDRQSLKICCPEEVAYINGWIGKEKLIELGESMKKNEYGQHLLAVARGRIKY